MLRKKIGGRRHREWAWAWVVIMAVVAAVAVWAAQEPATPTVGQDVSKPAGSAGANAPKDTSVAGVLAGIAEASAFNNYFVKNNIAASLGSGPYTIFVPTDSAIGALRSGTISGLGPAAQKRLVQYHIVSGKRLDTDAVASGNYQAMSKDYINFTVDLKTGVSYVGSGKVLNRYEASNGVIYTISSVLFPPAQ